MSAEDERLEALLARLYVDPAARARFLADPEAEARRAGVAPLGPVDLVGLELAAASVAGKRGRGAGRRRTS
jgi:hypothetical protein